MSDLWTGIELAIRPYLSYFLSPKGNLMFSLMVFVVAVTLYFIGRHWIIYNNIVKNRRRIPMVIGGWGTRGKSGTERLKTALFTGHGYQVVAKTTGSAAMFIRSIPGSPIYEIFIFRPYEKASIWEQQEMMKLAATGGSQVFLWECMALNQRYVRILQREWMRDDISTITNAYPDHEDIQGPTGFDVAKVISSFTPENAKLYTSEIQMLPILKETAKKRKTELVAVSEKEAALIPKQILNRFPYSEHPANIALIARLASDLGVDYEQALIEMADNVVPEIGVLKIFPEANVLTRRVRFANGMAANERAGLMNNWRRTGYDLIGLDDDRGHWVVTVVNNRADRISRSMVFANILVEDIFAHRHILVGTNLSGLRGFIHLVLDRHLANKTLIDSREYKSDRKGEERRSYSRLSADRRKLRLGRDTSHGILFFLDKNRDILPNKAKETTDRLDKMLPKWKTKCERMKLEDIRRWLMEELILEELTEQSSISFLAEEAAKHLVFDMIEDKAREIFDEGGSDEKAIARLNELFRKRLKELFLSSIFIIPDANIGGDELISRIAYYCPPGFRVSVMGMQNIKGPGLNLVYRWQAYEHVTKQLELLDDPSPQLRDGALTNLMTFNDYGMIDAEPALRKISRMIEESENRDDEVYRNLKKLSERLERIIAEYKEKMSYQTGLRVGQFLKRRVSVLFDFIAGINRAMKSDRISRDLLAGRISQRRAAKELRELMERQRYI